MRTLLAPCLLLFLVLKVLTGVAYPAFVTAAAQTLWAGPATSIAIEPTEPTNTRARARIIPACFIPDSCKVWEASATAATE